MFVTPVSSRSSRLEQTGCFRCLSTCQVTADTCPGPGATLAPRTDAHRDSIIHAYCPASGDQSLNIITRPEHVVNKTAWEVHISVLNSGKRKSKKKEDETNKYICCCLCRLSYLFRPAESRRVKRGKRTWLWWVVGDRGIGLWCRASWLPLP